MNLMSQLKTVLQTWYWQEQNQDRYLGLKSIKAVKKIHNKKYFKLCCDISFDTNEGEIICEIT